MSDSAKVLVVFCEGAHDVSFLSQVFKHCLAFKRTSLKLSEFPAPFDGLFRSSVARHVAEDLSLDMARKFFLPDQVLKKDQQWVLLDEPALGDTETSIDSVDYLFTYDIDEKDVNYRVNKVQKSFAEIDGESFIDSHFRPSKYSDYGYISHNKAVFV